MNIQKNTYCRFCAEPKLSDKMLNLLDDDIKFEEGKINFLNVMYVDVFNRNSNLPNTVCFVCYETFNKFYEFFEKVKKAQITLINITNDEKCESEDDDRMTGFDNFIDSDSMKIETSDKTTLNNEEKNAEKDLIEIKKEPKDEMEVAIDLQSQQSDTLNVHDILDAALCKVPYTDVTLYAKEVKETTKRIVSEWKEYPWLCSHCNIEFLDVVTLRLHSKTTHSKCSAFVCIDCDNYGSGDFDMFIKHVKMHRKRLR